MEGVTSRPSIQIDGSNHLESGNKLMGCLDCIIEKVYCVLSCIWNLICSLCSCCNQRSESPPVDDDQRPLREAVPDEVPGFVRLPGRNAALETPEALRR